MLINSCDTINVKTESCQLTLHLLMHVHVHCLFSLIHVYKGNTIYSQSTQAYRAFILHNNVKQFQQNTNTSLLLKISHIFTTFNYKPF